MKISIIVPIYNIEKYLEKCLNSIINQSYQNLEILLIDDGSTDNSSILCDEYKKKDKRIKVIHQKNQGLSSARNTGFKHSTGDFIWFIDGDDYIEENSIQQLLPYLENNDIVVFNYNNIKNNKTTKIKSFYDYKNIDVKYLLSHCMAWNKVFKRQILSNDFFPDKHIYEDLYSIPTLILKTKKITFLDKYLYNYVCRSNSIKNTSNKTSDRIYALNNLYSKLNNKYHHEIEYLFIYNLLITSLIEETTNKCKYNLYDLNQFVKQKYPKYCKNKYWKKLGIVKQIYLYMLYYNIFFLPRIITYLKTKKDSNG